MLNRKKWLFGEPRLLFCHELMRCGALRFTHRGSNESWMSCVSWLRVALVFGRIP
jgi:hypothetical protein